MARVSLNYGWLTLGCYMNHAHGTVVERELEADLELPGWRRANCVKWPYHPLLAQVRWCGLRRSEAQDQQKISWRPSILIATAESVHGTVPFLRTLHSEYTLMDKVYSLGTFLNKWCGGYYNNSFYRRRNSSFTNVTTKYELFNISREKIY